MHLVRSRFARVLQPEPARSPRRPSKAAFSLLGLVSETLHAYKDMMLPNLIISTLISLHSVPSFHTLTMAEVFGIASGAAGILSLLIQVNQGFEILRNARKQISKAPEELMLLDAELGFLILAMERVGQTAKPNDHVFVSHCETSCRQVIRGLNVLNNKFENAQRAKGAKKMLRVLDFVDWKNDVTSLRASIEGAVTKLSL